MAIPDEEVAQVRAGTDLVALVGEHAALRQQGQRWVGLCPFHNERTPSFGVNPRDGFYYCFGCHASGDAITFVRETEHLDFVDAVRFLAERAGVVLHETEEGGAERNRRGGLLDAMARAVEWYHERLLSSPDAGRARDYLRSRGYDSATVRRFTLGWAPDDWDALARALGALGVPDRVLVDCGLAFVNRAGRVQDAFRGRVLFPIFDPAGRAVAIGGRVLPGPPRSGGWAEPKYKNSPETPIYSKRRTLYGLNWAKHDVIASGEVVVCEGYTDVIGCFAAGVPRAVATCGTALGEEHFRLLRNFGRRIVLAYDADQAGQAASARVYEWERRHDVDLRVAALPPGTDPADLARRDPDALRAAVAGAVPFLEFRVARLLASADLSTAEGRAHGAEAALGAVAEHPDNLVRDQYVMRVATTTRLEADLLRERLDDLARAGARAGRGAEPRAGGSGARGERGARGEGGARRGGGAWSGSARSEGGAWSEGGAAARGGGGSVRSHGRGRRPARATRPGLEALRLAVHRPELVADRLEDVLFLDDLQRRAFAALAGADDLRQAVDRADPEVAGLLRRLSVEEPVPPDDPHADPADAVVAQLVREAVRQALAERRAPGAARGGDLASLATETATVRRRMEDLDDPTRCRGAAEVLVAWLIEASQDGL